MKKLIAVFFGDKSLGEATALFPVLQQLPKDEFQISLISLFGNDNSPASFIIKKIFVGYDIEYMLSNQESEHQNASSYPTVDKLLQEPPDVFLIGGAHMLYWPYPNSWTNPMAELIEKLEKSGTSIILLDVNGTICNTVNNVIPRWPTIVPQPLTFANYPKSKQAPIIPFSIVKSHFQEKDISARHILWVSSYCHPKWIGKDINNKLEQSVLKCLSTYEPKWKISTTPSISPQSCSLLKEPRILDKSLDYEDVEEFLSGLTLLMTTNKTSQIAARAAALGVPIVWVRASPGMLKSPDTQYFEFDYALTPCEFQNIILNGTVEDQQIVGDIIEGITELRENLWQQLRSLMNLPDTVTAFNMALNYFAR